MEVTTNGHANRFRADLQPAGGAFVSVSAPTIDLLLQLLALHGIAPTGTVVALGGGNVLPPAASAGKAKAEKTAAPTPSPAPEPAPAPAPTAAASAPTAPAADAPAPKAPSSAPLEYGVLQKAVFDLAGKSREAVHELLVQFGLKNFKELPAEKRAEALAAVKAKTEALVAA
jgi:hypothetical protein